MSFPPKSDDMIVLQVRAERFPILTEVLTSASPYFRALLTGPTASAFDAPSRTNDGAYIVLADPQTFEHIMRYLETNTYPFLWTKADGFDCAMYARILQAANQYQIRDLVVWIKERKYQVVVHSSTSTRIAHNNTEPKDMWFNGSTTVEVEVCQGVQDHWHCPISRHHDPGLCDSSDCWGKGHKIPTRSHVIKVVRTTTHTTINWDLLCA